MKPYWSVVLEGYGPGVENGDVITHDGEIIGQWQLEAEDHFQFIPDGEVEVAIWSAWLGEFCEAVAGWHEVRPS